MSKSFGFDSKKLVRHTNSRKKLSNSHDNLPDIQSSNDTTLAVDESETLIAGASRNVEEGNKGAAVKNLMIPNGKYYLTLLII